MSSAPHRHTIDPGRLTIAGGHVGGTVRVPGDKSISHRVALLAALASGTSAIRGFCHGDDCLATLSALHSLGVEHVWDDQVLSINGNGRGSLSAPAAAIDCGNSGTTMRLLCGLLAPQDFSSTLVGDDSLSRRPMERVAAPLRQMGARITTTDGNSPLRIDGNPRLRAARIEVEVASAQVKTALTLAALHADGESRISTPGRVRDHTERLLPLFGCPVRVEGQATLVPGGVDLQAIEIRVPGDISAAAFFMVAACLAGHGLTRIVDVGLNPGRSALIRLLQDMGARIEVTEHAAGAAEPIGEIRIWRSDLTGVDVPRELVAPAIDEFPALCVAAACASGETTIRGAGELRFKESDRIATMAVALRTLGVSVETSSDGLLIRGGEISGGTVDCGDDHRIAMALSILGLVSRGPLTVIGTKCIQTSFPGFQELLAKAGANIINNPEIQVSGEDQ
ncbi:MAG: 3-phosphoshikimate 1-carboxyvinyltransferase [Gammaproteobacteria bacterium]|nr:3-phosphoshikimate 1-carboxyvinyltransferase [Gammaproteobacteria bacterium]